MAVNPRQVVVRPGTAVGFVYSEHKLEEGGGEVWLFALVFQEQNQLNFVERRLAVWLARIRMEQ